MIYIVVFIISYILKHRNYIIDRCLHLRVVKRKLGCVQIVGCSGT